MAVIFVKYLRISIDRELATFQFQQQTPFHWSDLAGILISVLAADQDFIPIFLICNKLFTKTGSVGWKCMLIHTTKFLTCAQHGFPNFLRM